MTDSERAISEFRAAEGVGDADEVGEGAKHVEEGYGAAAAQGFRV